jgi:transposase-like protein
MQRRKFGREFKIEAVRLIKDHWVSVDDRVCMQATTRVGSNCG